MFDEMTVGGQVRPPYAPVAAWLDETGLPLLDLRAKEAEALFRRVGITFAVYGEGGDPERLIPFDLVPRVIGAAEWAQLAAGIEQRARALNAFLYDVYHRREILRAGRVPSRLVTSNPAFLPEMIGFDPPGRVYSHVVGIDLVRTAEDHFAVLEDNCRTPSGVSYMLENREIMMRLFPDLFAEGRVRPVDGYPNDLRRTLEEVAPPACRQDPEVAVLTPGPFNSAYYEHSYLADLMGAALVEARDLFVRDGRVWRRTTRGPRVVDVIYRRIDDDFLDPLVFRPDSMLGVPGLMNAYLSGGVTICSAPGAGVADDKAIYTYVPEMIDFYLGEKPILANVPTWKCSDPDDLAHVLAHLPELVVKEVDGSGGYGMLVGPRATKQEVDAYRKRVEADPEGFIAQPTLDLSTAPTLVGGEIEGRHVDLRPYCLVGKEIRLTPGGLTRVALRKGSLVVNSSQGGGVKDTWVLSEDAR
ncbi:circularly permuted type 2 ATP-grasp protein [Parvularcula dongshanensis]|uniref:Putative circularly permuted ATP-grasp superfamily protein n=1 Tax=Parvularcula dongshanensis TaxID=1173995 RepID=A0A840I520_9PROT|nr:circularly permuted type 2 ATP-grasp protein [Parvularcula dongshanensis]MBB4659381.1 putative circularly permuted ATP-grasp superfamily protein [Parvularcula dongshanensis]